MNTEHQCSTVRLLLDYCMNVKLTSWFKCRNSILMMKELMCVNSIVNEIWVYWFIFKLSMQLIDCNLPNLCLLLYSSALEPDQMDTIQIFLTIAYCSNRFKCLSEFSRHFSILFFFPLSFFDSHRNQAFFIWICNCFQ